MPVHEGLGTCDLKTPLPGAGGVCQSSRNRSRASASPVFRSKTGGKNPKGSSLFLLYAGSWRTRHMRPQNAPSRGRGCLPKFAEPLARSAGPSPVFRSKAKGEPSEGSPFACSAVAVRGWRRTRMLRMFRIFRIVRMPWMPWTPRGCSGPAGRKRPDGVFCCRFGRPVRRASVGGLLRAISTAPTAVPHPCVCGASGRASTPRAP